MNQLQPNPESCSPKANIKGILEQTMAYSNIDNEFTNGAEIPAEGDICLRHQYKRT